MIYKKNILRQVLSCLLVAILILTLSPATASAVDPEISIDVMDEDTQVEFAPTYPKAGDTLAVGSKQVQVIAKPLNETVTAYISVVADNSSAPNATQVIAGQDSSSFGALASASHEADTAGETKFTIALPSDATDYDAYVVLRDGAGNVTNPVKIDLRTPDAIPVTNVCQIGAIGYETLDLALNQVADKTATTITLLTDISDYGGMDISRKYLTFDLNGKTLTINDNNDDGLHIQLLSEVYVTGPGNLIINSHYSGLNVNQSKFITSDNVNVTIISSSGAGVSADSDCTIVVNGNVTGLLGVTASYNNTITISGTATAVGVTDQHCILLGETGNTVNVGNAIVYSGTGSGICIEEGGEVTVGSPSKPGQVSGKGAGIWTRMGTNTAKVTVYGDVISSNSCIVISDDSNITVHGNVRSTSSDNDQFAVNGYVNSDISYISIDGNVEGPNGVTIHGAQSAVTVKGNVTAFGTDPDKAVGVYASYANLSVEGNVIALNGIGVYSFQACDITVNGTITAAKYIKVKYNEKGIGDNDPVSTKAGYLQYSYYNDAFAWVKGVPALAWQLRNITPYTPSGGIPSTYWIHYYDSCYGNGTYVMVGSYATILTSPDGLTWQLSHGATSNGDPELRGVTYGNGMFVAVGKDYIYLKKDGQDWINKRIASINYNTVDFKDVAYSSVSAGSGGIFVAVGENSLWWSEDGETWKEFTSRPNLPNGFILEAVATDGAGNFVTVGSKKTDLGIYSGYLVWKSNDGKQWDSANAPTSNGILHDVAYGNGVFLAVGGSEGNAWISSDLGANWTAGQDSGATFTCMVECKCKFQCKNKFHSEE